MTGAWALRDLIELVLRSVHGVDAVLASTEVLPDADLVRESSAVPAPGVEEGADLCAVNLEQFIEAVTAKVLLDNLRPHIEILAREFRRVAGPAGVLRGWRQV